MLLFQFINAILDIAIQIYCKYNTTMIYYPYKIYTKKKVGQRNEENSIIYFEHIHVWDFTCRMQE